MKMRNGLTFANFSEEFEIEGDTVVELSCVDAIGVIKEGPLMAIQGEFCTFYGVTNAKALGEGVGYNFDSVGPTCSFHSAYRVST